MIELPGILVSGRRSKKRCVSKLTFAKKQQGKLPQGSSKTRRCRDAAKKISVFFHRIKQDRLKERLGGILRQENGVYEHPWPWPKKTTLREEEGILVSATSGFSCVQWANKVSRLALSREERK